MSKRLRWNLPLSRSAFPPHLRLAINTNPTKLPPPAGTRGGQVRAPPDVPPPLARHAAGGPLHAGKAPHWNRLKGQSRSMWDVAACVWPQKRARPCVCQRCGVGPPRPSGLNPPGAVGAPRRQRRVHCPGPPAPAQRPARIPGRQACAPAAGCAQGRCVDVTLAGRFPALLSGQPLPCSCCAIRRPPDLATQPCTMPTVAGCGVDGVKVDVQSTITMFGYHEGEQQGRATSC